MGISRLKSRRRQDPGSKWSRVTIAILATIGIIDTGSITLNRWGLIGSLACPGGAEGCDKVLNSPWGTLLQLNGVEIPLSFAGLISYLAILAMSILPLLPGLKENKANLSRRTWWWLFFFSSGMTTFSMLLLGLMVFKIEAFCFFCLLSALISISILILTLFGGGWDEPGDLLFKGILISLVVILGGLIWSSSVTPKINQDFQTSNAQGIAPTVKSQSSLASIGLAKHLKSSGFIMYSAYWCPHCHDQKEIFGEQAVKELTIIECAKDGQNNQHSLCELKGITGYPSWEINSKLYSGVIDLDELANISSYNGSRDF